MQHDSLLTFEFFTDQDYCQSFPSPKLQEKWWPPGWGHLMTELRRTKKLHWTGLITGAHKQLLVPYTLCTVDLLKPLQVWAYPTCILTRPDLRATMRATNIRCAHTLRRTSYLAKVKHQYKRITATCQGPRLFRVFGQVLCVGYPQVHVCGIVLGVNGPSADE